ncbi:MAG: hypothetical protein Q9227_005547 [Pyrenula ochraceoflavens]
MPPPMPQSRTHVTSRMTANPARPVHRYRPGKAVAEEASSEEEDESEEEQPQQRPPPRQDTRPKASSFPTKGTTPVRRDPEPDSDDDDEEGFVTEEEEEDGGIAIRPEVNKPVSTAITRPIAVPTGGKPQVSSQEESDENGPASSSGEEESSEETESSSSEDEATRRKLQRPTFIKKTNRNQASSTPALTNNDPSPTPGPIASGPSNTTPPDDEARRKELADLMIVDKLEKDALARAAGKKSWDDDEEVDPEDQVDDTDGLDPEAELAAWKVRELKRLKRDRETIEVREREIEEAERRRNLTKDEREAEDKEFLEKQKAEREQGRGKAGFLAKYQHRGAFFQDETLQREMARRDLMGASYEDQVRDKSALPSYLQVRDQTKVGKKGRTRYKDLRAEDTGTYGKFDDPRREKRRDENTLPGDVVDERFRPDYGRDGDGEGRGPRASGANAKPVGERRKRSRSPGLRERDKRVRIEAR